MCDVIIFHDVSSFRRYYQKYSKLLKLLLFVATIPLMCSRQSNHSMDFIRNDFRHHKKCNFLRKLFLTNKHKLKHKIEVTDSQTCKVYKSSLAI